MKKINIYYTILTILTVVGMGLLLWGAIKIDNYPQMKEIRHAAVATVKVQYWTGLTIMLIAWIFTGFKRFWK
jgi:hypothetical protein